MPSVSESWAPNGFQQPQCLCSGFGRRCVRTEGFGRGKSTRLGARDPAGIAENDFQALGKCAEAGSFGAILEPSCVLAFGVRQAFGRSRWIAGAGDFLEFRSGEQPVPPDFPHMTGIRRKRDSQFLLPTRVWSFVDNSAPEECAKENVYSFCRDSAPSALLAKRAECGRPRLSAKAGRTVVPSVRFGTVHKLGRPAFLNSSRPEWMLGLEPHHHEVRSEGARK